MCGSHDERFLSSWVRRKAHDESQSRFVVATRSKSRRIQLRTLRHIATAYQIEEPQDSTANPAPHRDGLGCELKAGMESYQALWTTM
jgi:hypothetical protein